MTDVPASANPARFEVRPTADTHFGWIRTRLSVERTMMAWMRTAVSLIGFGFAIVQFFERLNEMPDAAPALMPSAPKYFGLALIFSGVLALVISIWQYWWAIGYLRSGNFAAVAGIDGRRQRIVALQTPAVAVAIVLTLIGVSAGTAVLLRIA